MERLVGLVDPAGQAYPAEQLPEHALEPKAELLPKVPGGHRVHAAAPTSLNCPG